MQRTRRDEASSMTLLVIGLFGIVLIGITLSTALIYGTQRQVRALPTTTAPTTTTTTTTTHTTTTSSPTTASTTTITTKTSTTTTPKTTTTTTASPTTTTPTPTTVATTVTSTTLPTTTTTTSVPTTTPIPCPARVASALCFGQACTPTQTLAITLTAPNSSYPVDMFISGKNLSLACHVNVNDSNVDEILFCTEQFVGNGTSCTNILDPNPYFSNVAVFTNTTDLLRVNMQIQRWTFNPTWYSASVRFSQLPAETLFIEQAIIILAAPTSK